MNKSELLKSFSKIPYDKQQELIDLLTKRLITSRPILNHKEKPKCCPHCEHEKIYKHGTYKKTGGTRYKCQSQDCKKTFNDLTGTTVHCLKKKEEFRSFIEQMFEEESIRKIAKKLKLSTRTVFDWRHKALESFNNTFTKSFKGIVETDDIFFKLNQKGRKKNFIHTGKPRQGVSNRKHVSVMITLDRYKTFDFKLVCRGKINSKHLKREIDISRFNNENIICSDESTALIKFFKDLELNHITFKSEEKRHPKFKEYHVNNLNNRVGRLKRWIRDNFSSVSTKYLNHYLGYYKMMEILKNDNNMKGRWWDFMLQDTGTFKRNKIQEDRYDQFLKY